MKKYLAGGMPGTANSGLTVCPVLVRSNTEGPSGHQERLYRLKNTKVVQGVPKKMSDSDFLVIAASAT